MKTELLPINRTVPNKGQINNVPRMPRFVRNEKYKRLVQSIKDKTEHRGIIVYDTGNSGYVVLKGNLMFRAMKELGYEEIPCLIMPTETPADKLRTTVIDDEL